MAIVEPASAASGDGRSQGEAISALITALRGTAPQPPYTARQQIVKMGDQAVPALTEALRDPDPRLRWEVAKALAEIASPEHTASIEAGKALVTALEDNEPGVRWLAADALVAMGPASLDPLLHGLLQRSESVWLREGAHHVLHFFAQGTLAPVIKPIIEALDGVLPAISVLPPVKQALDQLDLHRAV